MSATSAPASTTRCSTRPVLVISTTQQPGRWSAAPARRAARSTATARGTARPRPGGSAGRAAAPCGPTMSSRSSAPSRKRLDRPALGRRQRLDRGEPVDEQPVALVGRDPAGAGVRLGDVALVLERGHVVADRGRRDAEVVPLDQRLGARPAPGWRRSPRRWRAARRACGPPARAPPRWSRPTGRSGTPDQQSAKCTSNRATGAFLACPAAGGREPTGLRRGQVLR